MARAHLALAGTASSQMACLASGAFELRSFDGIAQPASPPDEPAQW